MINDAATVLQQELGSGEYLLWSGRPGGGIRLRPSDVVMIPFSLMWGGFAIFWEYTVVSKGAPFFFMLWGIPFVLIGLYLIIGRFFVDAYIRNKTYYGVTNERIIIKTGLKSRKVISLSLKNIAAVDYKVNKDGSGYISFGPAINYANAPNGLMKFGRRMSAVSRLDFIDEVRYVYGIIMDAKNKTE